MNTIYTKPGDHPVDDKIADIIGKIESEKTIISWLNEDIVSKESDKDSTKLVQSEYSSIQSLYDQLDDHISAVYRHKGRLKERLIAHGIIKDDQSTQPKAVPKLKAPPVSGPPPPEPSTKGSPPKEGSDKSSRVGDPPLPTPPDLRNTEDRLPATVPGLKDISPARFLKNSERSESMIRYADENYKKMPPSLIFAYLLFHHFRSDMNYRKILEFIESQSDEIQRAFAQFEYKELLNKQLAIDIAIRRNDDTKYVLRGNAYVDSETEEEYTLNQFNYIKFLNVLDKKIIAAKKGETKFVKDFLGLGEYYANRNPLFKSEANEFMSNLTYKLEAYYEGNDRFRDMYAKEPFAITEQFTRFLDMLRSEYPDDPNEPHPVISRAATFKKRGGSKKDIHRTRRIHKNKPSV